MIRTTSYSDPLIPATYWWQTQVTYAFDGRVDYASDDGRDSVQPVTYTASWNETIIDPTCIVEGTGFVEGPDRDGVGRVLFNPTGIGAPEEYAIQADPAPADMMPVQFTYTGDCGPNGELDRPIDRATTEDHFAATETRPTAADGSAATLLVGNTDGSFPSPYDPVSTLNLNWSLSRGASTGHVIIEKQTEPNGAADKFEFTGVVAGLIGDDESLDAYVAPGSYVAAEIPTAGWRITSIDCSDTDSSGDTVSGQVNFVVDPGETVRCVFANSSGADLEATIDGPNAVNLGDQIGFTVTARNLGPETARGVTVAFDVESVEGSDPEIVSFAPGIELTCLGGPSGLTVSCEMASLAPGDAANVEIVIRPSSRGWIRGHVLVAATSPNDPRPSNNDASRLVSVIAEQCFRTTVGAAAGSALPSVPSNGILAIDELEVDWCATANQVVVESEHWRSHAVSWVLIPTSYILGKQFGDVSVRPLENGAVEVATSVFAAGACDARAAKGAIMKAKTVTALWAICTPWWSVTLRANLYPSGFAVPWVDDNAPDGILINPPADILEVAQTVPLN